MPLKPIPLTAAFLAFLAMVASISQIISDTNPTYLAFRLPLHLFLTVGLTTVLYLIVVTFSAQKKQYLNTLITGLILFLLLAPPQGTLEAAFIALAALISMLLKFFAVRGGRPVVNPVAGGVLLALILAALFAPEAFFIPSWWGASFNTLLEIGKIPVNLSLFLVLGWIAFGLRPWRKYPTLFAFAFASLATFAILLFVERESVSPLETLGYIYLDSTIWFFASIMLIEPKTSPIVKREQIAFGLFVGVIFALLNALSSSAPVLSFVTSYYDLTALTLGNVAFVAYQIWKKGLQNPVSSKAE